MKKIIFTQNCSYKGKDFLSGDELKRFKVTDLIDIWKLNEKGIIEPISEKEMKDIRESFNKKSEVEK